MQIVHGTVLSQQIAPEVRLHSFLSAKEKCTVNAPVSVRDCGAIGHAGKLGSHALFIDNGRSRFVTHLVSLSLLCVKCTDGFLLGFTRAS